MPAFAGTHSPDRKIYISVKRRYIYDTGIGATCMAGEENDMALAHDGDLYLTIKAMPSVSV